MKKALLVCFLLAIFPVATYAATVEELRAQIEDLLRRVSALQSSTGTQTAVSGGQCPLISRNLKNGMSGEDVTRLQQFLARDTVIYPEGTISGYYGALTEAAVKRFQCKHQIVCDGTPESTGYGVTGPRTAALLALQCSGGSTPGGTSANVGGYISVTPITGAAPLTVAIQATVNTTKSCTGATYEVIYGDNSQPSVITVPNGGCGILSQTFSHKYTTPGTYVVILRAGGHQSTATVVVTGSTGGTGTSSTNDTFSATPVSGNAPLNVGFSGKANASGSCSPSTYSVQFGDNTSANIPVSNCSVSTYAITHGYNSSGNYTARMFRGSTEVGAVSIAVGGGTGTGTGSTQGGGSFTADLGYGGDVFSVLATFSLTSSCTAYDIDWGDGSPHATQGTGSCATGVTTKEISHTYAGNGTYTITLKRGTGSGQTTDTVGVSVVY
jgi:peptidoglycan hydrolase-like protein with peptidoglycan-binding domain